MIRVNLLPQRRRRKFLPESGVVVVISVVICGLVWAYVWGAWRNHQMAAETSDINRKLVIVRRQVAEVLAIEAKIQDLKARETLLQSLEAREVPWPEMLIDLAARTPHDAWLASAAVSPGPSGSGLALSLQGSALSYNAVARFMTTLAGSPFYNDVNLSSAQRGGLESSPVIQFALSLTMRPLSALPAPAPASPSAPASSTTPISSTASGPSASAASEAAR